MFASVCVVTASWWQPLELIYKLTNYFRISWSSQTGNMEKHLLAAESWRGSAKLKRSCMNWWRALCKCHKTPWATLMLVQGAGRASWMSFFGCRVPVAEITYEQEGSQSLTWKSPTGRSIFLLGWAQSRSQVGALWVQLAKPRAHVSFCVLQGQNLPVLHFGLSRAKTAESGPGLFPPQPWTCQGCHCNCTSLTWEEFISRRIRWCGVWDAQLERITRGSGRN